MPLVNNTDRYLICWGGRGSSKSDFAAKKLIYRCLTEKYFRYILIRENYNLIRDSQYRTIQDLVVQMNLSELFEFKLNPLEIVCTNGNMFMCRGLDDSAKMKSLKDPTGCWWEDSIPEESDFITVTLGIRSREAAYLQEIFTVNPEIEGDFQVHWFYKKFFEGKAELNFRDISTFEWKPGEFADLSYTSHHSTYRDNRWITPQFVGMLEEMKRTNEYYYQTYCLGRWGNKITGGQFYKLFKLGKNTQQVAYDPDQALHLSWDFNVHPGVSCGIFQVAGKVFTMVDEIQLPTPRNTTRDVCREIKRKYSNHSSGMFIYGDPAGQHDDTRSERGFNDFTIIQGELIKYRPALRVAKQAPPVIVRGNFINTIFETSYNGIEIIISDKCHKMISDLLYGLEAADGTKDKTKVKDRITGVAFEKYGHFSDLLDYAVTSIFARDFNQYKTGGLSFPMMMGKGTGKNNLRNY